MSPDFKDDEPQRGATRHQEGPLHPRTGYETVDAQPGATLRAGLYILGTMFLTAAVVAPLYWFFARRETRGQERPATVLRAPVQRAESYPKLVVSEPSALAAFRAREDMVLDGYGWVEKDRGIARMPIAEAVRIVGERGVLPSWTPSETATGAQPAALSAPARKGGAR